MFTEERDKWDVLVGVIVTAIVVGGLYLANLHVPQAESSKPVAVALATEPQVSYGVGTVELKPDASPVAIASVYECWRGEQRILSDQTCGADASLRQVGEPNRMDAQDTSSLYTTVYRGSRRSGGAWSAGQGASTSDPCDSIEDQIDRINAQMRRPYGSQQGERFRDQLRALTRQRYEAKCIR